MIGEIVAPAKKSFLDLRFPREIEEKYQDERYNGSLFIYRLLAILGAALYGLFFLSDYRDFPDYLQQAFTIRFMVVIPILLSLAAFTFTRHSRPWLKIFTCVGLLVAEGGALALLSIIKNPQAQFVYMGSTLLMISITHSIIWQGYVLNAITSAIMVAAYGIVLGMFINPFMPLMKHMELLAAMAAFGATANYFVELHLRNEFKIASELRQQKRKAESATKLKDKFVAMVSHDLRAPLSSVLSLVELLRSPDGVELGSKRREEILQNVQGTLEEALRLINQLLKLSTLRTGKITVQKKIIAVRAMVDQQISNISHLAEKKGVGIINEIPDAMTVIADPALLGEVIHNLLANSVKFTKTGDAIIIFRKEGDRNEIAVKDTGSGISPDRLPHLFRHDSPPVGPNAQERGSGLGLPYSQDIIAAHGGSLYVESRPGEGSVFSVVLPGFRRLALVVDEDDSRRRMMRNLIRELDGVEIIEAEDGQAAQDAMDRITPDLVITSVNLPRVDGFTLLERTKANPRLTRIPFIVCAPMAYNAAQGAHTDENLKRAAISLGAAEFMTQPIAPEDFLPIVLRYVG